MSEALRITRFVFDRDASRAAGSHFYMCRHQSGRDRSMEEITASHDLDLMFQETYGVRWLSYFVSRETGRAFCLVEAPSREAVERCHLAAHGNMPAYNVIEVEPEAVRAFLGEIATPDLRQNWSASPFRTILFARASNAAELALRLGDSEAHKAVRTALASVDEAIVANHGNVVRHDSDSVLASFTSSARAVQCAILIQNRLLTPNVKASSIGMRIGLNAGEPVTDSGELFGAAVQLSREICGTAAPRSVFVTGVVRDLCMGKGFEFIPRGTIEIGGEEPVRLYEVQQPSDADLTPRPTRYPDGLTSRESEVLRLIAAGKSNQHIAAALVISLNTVARHVANILDKTSSANRTEAAAYAYRERLI
jgi:class 3 adenylate cyclase